MIVNGDRGRGRARGWRAVFKRDSEQVLGKRASRSFGLGFLFHPPELDFLFTLFSSERVFSALSSRSSRGAFPSLAPSASGFAGILSVLYVSLPRFFAKRSVGTHRARAGRFAFAQLVVAERSKGKRKIAASFHARARAQPPPLSPLTRTLIYRRSILTPGTENRPVTRRETGTRASAFLRRRASERASTFLSLFSPFFPSSERGTRTKDSGAHNEPRH